MPFELPPLPYAPTALEPHISSRTFEYHYGKHHQTYVANLNNLIKDSPLATASLEDIIQASARDETQQGIFNNAAQHWNHSFFWKSMSPNGGGEPPEALMQKIVESFGSLEKLKEQFKQTGISQFGSGWVWLVREDRTIKVLKTHDAATPLTTPCVPLAVCDVWEHAYYLDYQNRRADFLQTFLDHLIDWNFIAENMG